MPTTLDFLRVLDAWSGSPVAGAPRGAAIDLLEAAEAQLGSFSAAPPATWHRYLDATGRPDFLERLPDAATRWRWAESAFRAIRLSGYSLRTLLAQRVAAHPDRVLFEDSREADTPTWTYAQVARYARSLAGVFLDSGAREARVAIFGENCVDGACTDLACLLNGLLVSPINVHTDAATLAWMFDRLAIDTVVTDSDERVARLAEVRGLVKLPFRVFRTGDHASSERVQGLDVTPLRHACGVVS